MPGKSGYNNRGLYNSYDRNHKERQAEDYYATSPDEVYNILETLGEDLNNKIILEPCVGGGHMADAISRYCQGNSMYPAKLIGTDIKNRGWANPNWSIEYDKDFFADDDEPSQADLIIMNPPYSVIEPFTIRALEIATEKVIMLARWQFFEGSSRYENILRDNPPTEVYVYVDRIQCWKNGIEPTGSSAQAYCWIIWDKSDLSNETKIKYIRRSDKKDA